VAPERSHHTTRVARVAVTLLLLVLLAPAAAAHAATVPTSIEGLAASADAVVIARVTAASSRQLDATSPESPGSIVTDADLQLERALKGARPASFRLTVLGGQAGGVVMVASESPQLAPGQRLVLFLDAQGRIIGGLAGALEIAGSDVPAVGLTLAQLEARVTGVPLSSTLWTSGLTAVLPSGLTATAITAVSPSGQPAGTLSTVTITGSGFGASKGTVRFPTGSTAIAAPIVSWTETQVVCVVPVEATATTRKAASSGLVSVTTASGAVTKFLYRVGFGYAGVRWAATVPGPTVVRYRVKADGSAPPGALARVQAGAAVWNEVAPSYFVFTVADGGTADYINNGVNSIYWSTAASTDPLRIAENQYWYSSLTGRIIDSDIVFYPTSAGVPIRWSDGENDTFDIANVAAHEMGHAIALLDQYGDLDVPKLMYYQTVQGAHPELSDDDEAGLRFAYDPTYRLPGPTVPSLPVVDPVATSVTIGSSASRVRYPRSFVLSGILRPGWVGDPVVAEVRKPGSARWSYSSARLCYTAAPSGGAAWWYRYTPRLRGTYYFRARYYGSPERYGSLSRTISVSVVR